MVTVQLKTLERMCKVTGELGRYACDSICVVWDGKGTLTLYATNGRAAVKRTVNKDSADAAWRGLIPRETVKLIRAMRRREVMMVALGPAPDSTPDAEGVSALRARVETIAGTVEVACANHGPFPRVEKLLRPEHKVQAQFEVQWLRSLLDAFPFETDLVNVELAPAHSPMRVTGDGIEAVIIPRPIEG